MTKEIVAADIPEPPIDCELCPRLVDYRRQNQEAYPDWFNGAAPSFGPKNASLLIVGLAPGLRGANRTGRSFTGDDASKFLFDTLGKFGFSNNKYDARADDGLKLKQVMITNAVRCVPPQNKPIAAEIKACRPYLIKRIDTLPLSLIHI